MVGQERHLGVLVDQASDRLGSIFELPLVEATRNRLLIRYFLEARKGEIGRHDDHLLGAGTRNQAAAIDRSATMVSSTQEAKMDDGQIHGTIEQLVAEEHELWEREAAGTATDGDRRRLDELKVSLDQCWDLLRQRRARRDAGLDPDGAAARAEDVVERYLQ